MQRPNKAQPITCEREPAIWTKDLLGNHDGQSLQKQTEQTQPSLWPRAPLCLQRGFCHRV